MRRYAVENAYEQLKALTRGQRLSATAAREFIATLAIPDDAKKELLALTPASYLGVAEKLAREI